MRRVRKSVKNGVFWHVLTRDSAAIARIENRRTEADSVHDFALILYTSLFCEIDTRTLNCRCSWAVFGAKIAGKIVPFLRTIKNSGIY